MAEREGDNIIVTIRRSKLFGKPQEEEQPCLGPSGLEICLIQDQIPVDHKADTVINKRCASDLSPLAVRRPRFSSIVPTAVPAHPCFRRTSRGARPRERG